ncbi:MAG: hypothetical protein R3A51_03780 [Nannocystaceae bacterium]|nr:hypothetical protein [Myxococcales bacterium]
MKSPSLYPRILLSLLGLSLGACTPDPGETTDAGTTAGTDETSDPSATASSDATDASTTAGTDATTTDTDGTSSSSSDTDDPTTSTGEPDGACEALCALLVACEDTTTDSCLESCESGRAYYQYLGTCGPLYDAALLCIGGFDCAEYDAFQAMPEASICAEQVAQIEGEGAPSCALEELPASCAAFCDHSLECGLDEDLEECQLDCAGTFAANKAYGSGPACDAAVDALYACYAKTDCADLLNESPCADETNAVELACG